MRRSKEARSAFRATSAIAATLVASWGCDSARPPGPDGPYAPYPSVVLVTIDTLRADHLPTYGYPRATSPFLDRLAADGVVFTRAHATVSHTAPSHASMFTGLLPHQHGVQRNGEALSPDVPSVARAFDRAGYRTAAFTSVGFVNRTATGFETVEGDRRKGEKTVDRALAWLDTLAPDEPFFLWVHLFDVHQAGLPGIRAPREHYAALRRGTPLDADAFYDFLAELHGLPDPPPGEPFELPWDPEAGRPSVLTTRDELLRGIDHYDAQILYVDAQIERLFDVVRDRGAGPSLWIVTADHGEGLGSHGYRGHGEHVYQEQLRVPLIFHASDGSLTSGRRDELVSLVDLFPTLAATLDGPPPEPVLGVSLWPLLLGDESAPDRDVVFAQKRPSPEVDDRVFVAIWPGRKYILHTQAEDEFFDLDADPRELENEIAGADAAPHRDRLLADLETLGWSATSPTADDDLPADVLEELKALGYVR